jgi:hypothetical protein
MSVAASATPGVLQRGIALALGEGHTNFDVADARRGDPQVGAGPVDQARGGRREPDEQAELDDDQHDGEDDAGQRDAEADLVVDQVAPGEVGHGQWQSHGVDNVL